VRVGGGVEGGRVKGGEVAQVKLELLLERVTAGAFLDMVVVVVVTRCRGAGRRNETQQKKRRRRSGGGGGCRFFVDPLRRRPYLAAKPLQSYSRWHET